ncbi:MAG TPA: apolipoprotein N-acyltransferase, partial [Bacteroidia bacterium]|nr:apolipoprotein N-acyltransferase [Bacteroidia bacterium]
IVFFAFHKVKRMLPEKYGTFVLIPFWIIFEHFHLDWDLSWPWLTLGNGLVNNYTWIQWYEYTGVFGGSFWILLINVLLFEFLRRRNLENEKKARKILVAVTLSVLLLPVLVSYIIYFRFDVNANTTYPLDVVVVQPNIDPYQKFTSDFRDETEKMLSLAAAKTDSSVDYVVMPETALVESIWENDIQSSWSIHRLRKFRERYPKLNIVTGATTGYYYKAGEKLSSTARKFSDGDEYYDNYNTALEIDSAQAIQLYHKSKLVPGVEKMPFPQYLGFLDKYAIDLGGTVGSLGMQDERTVFRSPNGPGKVAPVICYESIYGDYVSQYIRNGADYIFIITNDGWWGNTPGYKQHLLYGRLRAIETRKSIARAANTGISCFIDQRGDFFQRQPWWTASAIRQKIVSTAGMTFYTEHGDYIVTIMDIFALLAITGGLVRMIMRKRAVK